MGVLRLPKLLAAIFDMDGVLTDTVPLHYKAWHRMFTEEGYAFDFQVYKEKVDGKPRMDGIAAVATDATEQQLLEMAERKQRYFLELVESEPPQPFADAVELVQRLKQEGLKTAVASSSKNTERILKQMKIYDWFETVVTGHDFRQGKPNPEIFLTAAHRLGIAPEHCVVFEDAIEGVNAGLRAGMLTIGVARHGNEQALQHAHRVVPDMSGLTRQHLEAITTTGGETHATVR
jgi:beta-phosphoglucomutase